MMRVNLPTNATIDSKVADAICNSSWILPPLFSFWYPHISHEIEGVILPNSPTEDRLIWKHSRSGSLTLKDSYNSCRKKLPKQSWCSLIWKAFIPPKLSVLVWRIFHNKLPTDDQLQRRGIPLVSACQTCNTLSCGETIAHLFSECSFAQALWQWMAGIFNTRLPGGGSWSDFWTDISGFPSQLYNMWITACLCIIQVIWKTRNSLKFQDAPVNVARAMAQCKKLVITLCKDCPGHVKDFNDLAVFSRLGIDPNFGKAPKVLDVIWRPPSIVKVNTDGLSKKNPGLSACGGLFRDHRGLFLGGFAMFLGQHSAFFAEFMAVIFAIENAYSRGWHRLWIECDSLSLAVTQCLTNSHYAPPWQLHTRRLNCLDMLKVMEFHISHIYREGNKVADLLANMGLEFSLVGYPSSGN